MSLSSKPPLEGDTIAAIATPPGEGGIGIVRLSGAQAIEIVSQFYQSRSGQTLFAQPSFSARMGKIIRTDAANQKIIDEVLVLVMKGPHTYTREDIVEIQAHGGPVVLRAIMDLAVRFGARTAEPGEFTKRAFLAGRLDLMQAEAVLDLIHAKTEAGRAFAASQLNGGLSSKIEAFKKELLDILSHLEANIDFPDDFTQPEEARILRHRVEGVIEDAQKLLLSSALGFVAKKGLRVVIWGRPNVGKSSLLNALSQKNRVIVTPHPGTTRDVVEEEIELRGFPIRLVDTAGVQETIDPIEKEGVARSKLAVLAADVVLHVLDGSCPFTADEEALLEASSTKPRILVINKSDLPAVLKTADLEIRAPMTTLVRVSCQAKNGLQPLEDALVGFLNKGDIECGGEAVISTIRQKDALEKVIFSLRQGSQALGEGLSAEFPSSDIRRALAGLSELTGEITNDDVLDRLFSQFCIGK